MLNHQSTDELGRKKPRLAALDCGIKFNILRSLCQYFEVIWCPPDTSFDTLVEEYQIDALFRSNGPGDPAHSGKAASAKETLAKAVKSLSCDGDMSWSPTNGSSIRTENIQNALWSSWSKSTCG